MRTFFLFASLLLLTRCSGVSDYSPDSGSRSSITGNQGGAGVQANLWSDDPSKKTVTNQNGRNSAFCSKGIVKDVEVS